jgi:hypothetical protein
LAALGASASVIVAAAAIIAGFSGLGLGFNFAVMDAGLSLGLNFAVAAVLGLGLLPRSALIIIAAALLILAVPGLLGA